MTEDVKTLHVAFSVARGYACILAKDADGGVHVRHTETLHVDVGAYPWRALWLAALHAAQRHPDSVVFYTDYAEVADTLKQYRQSEGVTTGNGAYRRSYSVVAGLKKEHPAYAYIRSIVPMLNTFWPGTWQITTVPAERLTETKALAPVQLPPATAK